MTRQGAGSSLAEPTGQLLVLLSESASSGPLDGRKKLMKLGFLAEHLDPENGRLDTPQRLGSFEFVIYKYGPFSRDLLDAFDTLRDRGLVEERVTEYEHEVDITDRGSAMAEGISGQLDDEVRAQIDRITAEYGDKPGSVLENESLELLGISREERSEYQGQPVDVVITEGPLDSAKPA